MLDVDPFSLLNADEDAVVDSILQGMLDKELVKDEFKSDLGFNGAKKEPDPRLKMHMRHQQVSVYIAFTIFFTFSVYLSGTCSPGWSRTNSRRAVKRLYVCVCLFTVVIYLLLYLYFYY